jgi:hypothetical protein
MVHKTWLTPVMALQTGQHPRANCLLDRWRLGIKVQSLLKRCIDLNLQYSFRSSNSPFQDTRHFSFIAYQRRPASSIGLIRQIQPMLIPRAYMSQQELLERSFCVYKVPNMVVAVIITLMNYPQVTCYGKAKRKLKSASFAGLEKMWCFLTE